MRVIGIDIGFATCGWAVVEKEGSYANDLKLVDYGVIITDKTKEIQERIEGLFDDMKILIEKYTPDHMAIESIFYFKNQKTIINVSQARGVVLLAAQKSSIPVFHYTPLQVKISCTGYGRAEKKQIQKTIQLLFKLAKLPTPDDAADALAICVCHINSYREGVI